MAQSTVPLILRLLSSSATAATHAGKIIRDVMKGGNLGIVEKAKNDLQTEADRSAQNCILTSLSAEFPNIAIIGEEEHAVSKVVSNDWMVKPHDPSILLLDCPQEYLQVSEKDIVVWVDPLDGTSEYTQGLLDHVTVLIGIAVNGKAVGGVIHQPYYNYKIKSADEGRTLWGLVGLGVGGFSPQESSGGLIVTTTRSHSNKIIQEAVSALNPDEILRVGGAGHKVLLLMEGKAHAYVFASNGCKKWDTCAPEAILTAIGGKLTDIHGKNYTYDKNVKFANTNGVFATAKNVDHSNLLSKIPQSVKDTLS